MTETIQIPATWALTGFPSVDAEPRAMIVECAWCRRRIGTIWVRRNGTLPAEQTVRCCGGSATIVFAPPTPLAATLPNDPPGDE